MVYGDKFSTSINIPKGYFLKEYDGLSKDKKIKFIFRKKNKLGKLFKIKKEKIVNYPKGAGSYKAIIKNEPKENQILIIWDKRTLKDIRRI